MAVYVANNASRSVVTLVLSKAEAEALLELVLYSDNVPNFFGSRHMVQTAADRAIKALSASTDSSARRAGFFE